MRLRLVILLAAAASLAACAQASQPTPKTDEEKTFYSLGVILAKQFDVKSFDLTDKEMEMVKAGLADGARDKALFDDKALQANIPKLQELQGKRAEVVLKREKDAGAAYLTKAAAEAGANKTASGLVYKVVKEGTGASPKATDVVKVHYVGKFVDGKVFDSSIENGEPATFPLNGVITCWGEGVQLMKVGGKANLVCPPELAYGEEGRPPQMRGGATLSFEVELLEINPAAEAPAAAGGASPH
jgi:FKBP-type peptidyl-prolyl cis-trans isomerase